MNFARYIQAILLAFMTAIPLISCAQEPELVGLTSVVFNYSQEALAEVRINGKTAGTAIQDAKIGDVSGGGGSMCCVKLSPAWNTVDITVLNSDDERYTIRAKIEQPWPEFVHYAAIHVLPGRKAIIEISPTMPWDRMDLLKARLKEMRQKK